MSRVSARGLRRPSWPALTWLGVLVVTLSAGVLLAVNSDAAKTDVQIADPPKTLDQQLAEQVSPLWSANESVDDRRTVASNTVIVSTEHGVRGLDPLTGEERWHYLRPTASMCDLTVLDDVVVAIFRTTGRCNEAVALEAGSGLRRWYRNVGFSDRLSLLGSGTAAVAATPGGIAALDAVGNSIMWRYNPPRGCELSSIVVGSSGVVVLERCTTGTTWLAQFELYSGQQQWRVPPPLGDVTLIGADEVVSLLAEQRLWILSARDGATLSTLSTTAEPANADTATAIFVDQFGTRGIPLVYLAGTLSAYDRSTGAQLWGLEATGLPASSELGIVVPEAGGFVTRNPLTGVEVARSVIADDAVTGDSGIDGLIRVEQSGSALIAVTQDGIIAYG